VALHSALLRPTSTAAGVETFAMATGNNGKLQVFVIITTQID